MLHSEGYIFGGKESIQPARELAIVVEKIGRFALEKDIPLCIPNSPGFDYIEDCSRIVYHP